MTKQTQAGSPSTSTRILIGLVIVAYLVFGWRLLFPSATIMPNDAMRSVVLIQADVEVEENPFAFFFGRFRSVELSLSPAPLPAPVPAQKIVQHFYGTGFVVNGQLITANHVVATEAGQTLLRILLTTADGRTAPAEVVRQDKASDLAQLATPLRLPSLTLASRAPIRGDNVTQIGNPAVIRFVVTHGTIVGFDRHQGYNIATIDTFGGNSGGPDLNDAGEVVGMCHTLISGSRFTGIGTLQDLRDFLNPDITR